MKKFICMAALAAMVLTGCGSSASTGSASSGAVSSETTSSSSAASSETASGSATAEQQAKFDELKSKLFTDGTNFPQLAEPEKGEEIAVLTTNMGTIKIKLCPEQAPKAVENFKGLINKGYYDGLKFHRVINDFMIQGGDPNGNGTGGESIWGGKFDDEFSGDLYHFRGALAYANSGANTNGSQFYIVQAPKIQDGYFDNVDNIIKQYGDEYFSSTEQIRFFTIPRQEKYSEQIILTRHRKNMKALAEHRSLTSDTLFSDRFLKEWTL